LRLVTRFFTRFSLQSTAGMSEISGTDARFPYEHRQNVVVRLLMFLLSEQEQLVSNWQPARMNRGSCEYEGE
jgi:uncharacterized protein YaeQ